MANIWLPGDSDLALALREPNLLVPGRRPVGPVEVIDYWKSRGLTLFQTAELSVINNKSSFIADTAGKVITRDGPAWNFDDTNKYVTFDAPQNSSGTVWVLLRNDRNYTSGGNGRGALASTRNSSNQGWTFELYQALGSGSYGGQNYVNQLAFTIQGVAVYSLGVSNNGLLEYLYPYPTSVSGSFTSGSSIDFYINGSNVGNRSIGSITATAEPLIIGSQGPAGSGFLPLGEPILAVAYFDERLSDSDLQQFDAFARDFSNRLLKPANSAPFLIGVAGGGATEISCGTGSVVVTGTNASIQQNVAVACSTGSVTITGANAGVEVNRNISTDVGSVVITGANATVEVNRNISAAVGSVVITGADATIQQGTTVEVSCGVGSVTITGSNAAINQQTIVDCATSAVTITGTDATVEVNRNVSAAAGSVVITGTDAVIDQQVTGQTNIVCGVGSVVVTGTAAVINQVTELDLGTGSIVVTGLNATIGSQRSVSLGIGNVEITGINADILSAVGISCGVGSIICTGIDATITGSAVQLWTAVDDATTTWTEVTSSSDIWTEI